MKNKFTFPEIPLCTNILRLQSYLLVPDELILFDWLVVKQFSFGYKEFHYSQARIEDETRIRRTRLDVIIDKFKKLGFLTVTIKDNKQFRGRVRYFYVDFNVLADKDVLCEIINPKDSLFKAFIKYLKAHAVEQMKAAKPAPKETFDRTDADILYQQLNYAYDVRRQMYNEGDLTDTEPEKLLTATQLPRNKLIDRKLVRLLGIYDEKAVENAFVSYTDAVFKGEVVPDNFMNYFLTYDSITDSFVVVDKHLNHHNLYYRKDVDYY